MPALPLAAPTLPLAAKAAPAAFIHHRPGDETPSRSLWASVAVALLFEGFVLVGAGWLLRPAPPPPPAPIPITLDLTALPPEPKKEEVKKEEPKPPEPVKKLEPVKQIQRPQPKPQPAPPPKPLVQPPPPGPVSEAPSAFAEAPPPPPPPPPPQAVSHDAELLSDFQAQARAAVQSALRYPNAARMLKLTGQTRLAFDYLNGEISNARIANSSGHESLDQAALEALERAALPFPKEFAGRRMHLEILVQFAVQP